MMAHLALYFLIPRRRCAICPLARSLWHYKRQLGVGWPSRKTIEECRVRAQKMRCYGIIPFTCLGRLCERAISGFSTNIIQQFEVNRTLSDFLDSSFTLASRAR